MTASRPSVSVICPVFNEEQCVPLFFERLRKVVEPLAGDYDFHLIFTNNASTDGTLAAIKKIQSQHDWISVITLSRNFGYQGSLMCGLRHTDADATIIIDVDCEDPPEMIPAFLEKWREGYRVVYGERTNRPEHVAIKTARHLFYRFTRSVADNDFILDMAEFSLFDRVVRDVIVRVETTFPFIRNEIAYAGYSRFKIPYTREPRISGETHYNLLRMAQFAVAGILTASTFPLRLTFYVGGVLALVDVLAAVAAVFGASPDWAPLYLLNAAFLVAAAMAVAVYTARIYKDGIKRPIFIVDAANTDLRKR